MKTTTKLPFVKETKNMLQYQAPKEGREKLSVPTIYVRKSDFESPWPDYVTITVTTDD